MIFCITDIYLKEKMYKPMLILHFVNVDYQESIAFQNSFFAHISILYISFTFYSTLVTEIFEKQYLKKYLYFLYLHLLAS